MGADEVQCIEKEREALLRFKAALGNSSLVRWFSWGSKQHKTDCCAWEGVFCDNQTGHVIKLHLPGEFPEFRLKGEMDASLLVELQYLMYLNLSFNYFEDRPIPEFLGSLNHLRYLDLHNCRLSGGNIPTQLGLLSHLQYLDLSGNWAQGAIPYQLRNLLQLQYLDLSYNQLEGEIPYQLENLSQLRHLDLSSNSGLTGAIPRQLGNLVQLEHLDLSANNHTASIPFQLGNFSQLQYLDLSYNSFDGVIPCQLGNLSNLQYLLLSSPGTLKIDQENGAGCEWLSSLTSLTHLKLEYMTDLKYSHKWLQMIAKLPNLKELIMPHNNLSDEYIVSLPSLKFNSSSFSRLDLTGNKFESSIVFHWILNISTTLVDLSLYWNHLEGPIP
ncbi:receptor-like protein 12 [Neltuma alba]|uniref:receptor-like protein 12 n=1 Tax=Neltuma alba TaxID=207710 RepID=UPI0010A2A98C|nr:receptor-like protein 12 [Prosopis alba]